MEKVVGVTRRKEVAWLGRAILDCPRSHWAFAPGRGRLIDCVRRMVELLLLWPGPSSPDLPGCPAPLEASSPSMECLEKRKPVEGASVFWIEHSIQYMETPEN